MRAEAKHGMVLWRSDSGLENGAESAQNGESEKRTNVEGVKNGGNDVAEEVEIGIAEVTDCGQRLPFPRDVGEPTQQNPNHQNAAVYVQPLPQPRRHNRQRRVQRAARPGPHGSEEQRSNRGHGAAAHAGPIPHGNRLGNQNSQSHERGERASASPQKIGEGFSGGDNGWRWSIAVALDAERLRLGSEIEGRRRRSGAREEGVKA